MSAFLSDEWLAELQAVAAGLPAHGDAEGVVQCVVTGVPERKKVSFVLVVAAGRLVEVRPGADPGAVCTVTWDHDAALEELSGRVHGDVSFMLGAKKVEGDYADYLLRFQPLLGDEAGRSALAGLAERSTTA
jgi:hypothetical protein